MQASASLRHLISGIQNQNYFLKKPTQSAFTLIRTPMPQSLEPLTCYKLPAGESQVDLCCNLGATGCLVKEVLFLRNCVF